MANTIAFDEQFYLQQNPDVAAAVSRGLIASGAQHYNNFGRFEARNPNAFFNTSFYLGQYPDVARAGVNPLTHFLTFGVNEARVSNATALSAFDTDGNGFANEFNASAYLSANPDVAAAVTAGQITAYSHFLQFGQFEGRTATLANGTVVTGPLSNVPASASAVALTVNADSLVGTAANDVYNAFVNSTANSTNSTLTAADSINGGAGTDQLNITVEGTAAGSLPAANITNVENFFIRDVNSGGASTYDFGSVAGEQQVWSDRSTAAVEFANVGAGATVGLAGNGSTVLGNVTAGYVASATAGNVAIKGGVGASGTAPTVTVTGSGIVTQNLTSSEAANKIGALTLAATTATLNVAASANLTTGAITGAALKSVVLTGSGNVDLSAAALPTAVTSVDGSKLTGSLSVQSGANTTAITGGSGNDTVNIGTLVYDQSAKIDGGAGTDILAIADSTATLFTTASKANITNFEVLQVSGTSKTFDFTALNGITAINVAAGDGNTITNLGASTPVTVIGDQATNLTLSVKDATSALSTADALTLTLDKAGASTTTSTVTVANITSNGLETLNIVSQGITGNTSATTDNNVISSLSGLSTSNVSTINVSGTSDLSITTGDIARTVNINGSAATGNLTINATGDSAVIGLQGGSGADKLFVSVATNNVVQGGAGNDTIGLFGTAAGAGSTTLTGGAGADKFAFSADSAANALKISTVASDSATTNLDKITDFNFSQGDKISFFTAANAATAIDGTVTAANPTSFTNAGTVTAANLNAAVSAAFADSNFVTTGNQAAVANQAILFNWNDGTTTHTYIAVNDGTAAYAAGTDFVVEITGATLKSGDAALGTLNVTDYFG